MGSKKSGAARTPNIEKNTLYSYQKLKTVDLIGAGEIAGFFNGNDYPLKSIYLNDTPVQNKDGSLNHSGISIQFSNGAIDQGYLPGFTSVDNAVTVGAEVEQKVPITRTVVNPLITSVRVTVGVDALMQTTKEGDQLSTSVDMTIQIIKNGAVYASQNMHLNEKGSQPFRLDFVFSKVPEAPFDIKCIRLWNKLTGRIPEPYPTLEKEPLSKHELSRALYGCKVETESFQALLNERYADIQEDPRAAIQNLDNVLNESRERLDNLSLQASEALNVERAERIQRQLEIQGRIAESSRQEEMNQSLSQDERTQDERALDEPKLSQTQEIDQLRQDEIKGFYDNRLDAINQELQAINEARQAEGYWDQSSDIINADMALVNQLTEERNELYQVLEQSSQEQQAYLEVHPELEKTFDSRVTDEDLAKLDADLATLNDNRQDSDRYATDKEIDELSQSLNIADKNKSWWDKTVDVYDSAADSVSYGMEYVIEGSKTTLAVAEGAAIGTVNTFQEGFANVSAMGVGVYVGLTEWDFDKGLDATVDIMNNISDYDHHWELSDFSKGQLANSENMQYVANLIHNQSEEFYGAVGNLWGDDAEEFTRGLYSAGGKIMTITAGGAVASGALNTAKGVMLGTSRAAPTNIFLKTENLEQIYNSGRIWGQTEGSVYGMTTENASVARTFIDPKTIDAGTIHLKGEAAALFKPHEVTGIFSGIKRAVGQYKAPFGDIVFGEGKGVATFDATMNTLTISQAEIGGHAARNIMANKAIFGWKPFGEGIPLSEIGYKNFAASKLWGRRSFDIISDAAVLGIAVDKTKGEK